MLQRELHRLQADSTVADLPAHDYCVSAATPGFAVAEELQARTALPGVIIKMGEKEPLVISRQRFFQQMSRGFSREIYLRRPIDLLARSMPHATLRLDADCLVSVAASQALERPQEQVYEPALVRTGAGGYRLIDAYVLLLAQTQLLALANRTIVRQKEDAEEANRALRETQAALIQSEKLASLGQLAAGMSHEINNPIAFVSTNVGILYQEFQEVLTLLNGYRAFGAAGASSSKDGAEDLARRELAIDLAYTQANYDRQFRSSLDGLKRIRHIVRNLSDFARLDRADWQETDLNDCVRSTLEMLCHEVKSRNLNLETDLTALPLALVQPGKINQVLLNLLMNAIQASSAGGTIRVTTRAEPCQGICLVFSDNGCGIPAEHLPHVFEPFFTTKPVGQGTGLGLSISYGIVRDHGGAIDVESASGQGSIFRVRLPLRPPGEIQHGDGNDVHLKTQTLATCGR